MDTLVKANNIVTTFPYNKERRTRAVDGVSLGSSGARSWAW